MDSFSKKFFVLLFIGIIFAIFLVFLFFFRKRIFNLNTKVADSDIQLRCSDQGRISIINKLPLTDNVGRKMEYDSDLKDIQGYLDCVLQSNSSKKVDYEIYLLKDSVDSLIDANYVKVYLSDGLTDEAMAGYDSNAVPTYSDLRVADSNPAGARLYANSLNSEEKFHFKLRMWLSDSYVITNEVRNFSVKVNVKVK